LHALLAGRGRRGRFALPERRLDGHHRHTVATNPFAFTLHALSGATAGRTYTFSVYLKGGGASVGDTVIVFLREQGGAAGDQDSSASLVLTADWQRVSMTRTIAQNDRTQLSLIIDPATGFGVGEGAHVDGSPARADHKSLGLRGRLDAGWDVVGNGRARRSP
jgi:hypothetical protein